MTSKSSVREARGSGTAFYALPQGYLTRSQAPLTSLLFLLPLLILYELGTYFLAYDAGQHTEQRIKAFNILQQFFHLFGVSGRFLPALAVAAILLAWHIARKDRWHLDFATASMMAVESVALSLPIFALEVVVRRYVLLASPMGHWPARCVISLGAGIYEELVFRLIGFTLLTVLFVDILKMQKMTAILLMVLITSIGFSLYHYGGDEAFAWRTFVFRSAAGIYFAAVFCLRGFGITAGCHAAYDLVIVAITTPVIS
jgi:hypothetical protein